MKRGFCIRSAVFALSTAGSAAGANTNVPVDYGYGPGVVPPAAQYHTLAADPVEETVPGGRPRRLSIELRNAVASPPGPTSGARRSEDADESPDSDERGGMDAAFGGGSLSAGAQPGDCLLPPVLDNPRKLTVARRGGVYSFGDREDVEMTFPQETVVGPVTINGGRNIHVIGGKMDLHTGHFAIAFNNNAGTGQVFVEGMDINVNNRCDVFALRNQRGAQLDFVFQNIFAYGPGYNVVDGDCHGDLMQFQAESGGGIALRVENFTGYTGGQGFFLPDRTPGDTRVAMKNVNVDYVADPYRGGLTQFYFYDTRVAADRKKYPVELDNVYAAWTKPDRQVAPWKAMDTDHSDPQAIRFLPSSRIDGKINKGHPNGGDFVTPSEVGLNYQRAIFCTN